MSEATPPKPSAEVLAKDLKASLAKRRPSTFVPVLAAVVICSALLGLLLYIFYPRAKTPPLLVVPLDGVFNPTETPHARAHLFAADGNDAPTNWAGHMVAFDDLKKPKVVPSDVHGQASVEWPTEDEFTVFFTRFVNHELRQGSMTDAGRIYVWPKKSALLLVDADEALADAHDKARDAIGQAREDGWRVIYLALATDQPGPFRQVRDQVWEKMRHQIGPVLARPRFLPEDTTDLAKIRGDTIKSLKNKFDGPFVAIVTKAETAQAFQDLGVRPIRIGDAATPTWADVSLKKP